jgi:hypothetical protein
VITLSPSALNLTSPLQFQRSQDVYINSYLQLNCTTSLSTIAKWTIKQCSSVCATAIQLGQSVSTTDSELFIPGKSLSYGIYELKLTVTMGASPNLNASASVYVAINPSSITANMAEFGTSMITHGYHQNLTLNPGAYSIDPDANTFNASVCHYLCM